MSRSAAAASPTADAAAFRPLAPAAPALPLRASVLGATAIVLGILWDISWHRSIGRDTFWTPAHMAIYFGGLLAGLAAGTLILGATFGSGAERMRAIRIGRLRGPLGAWVMVWGALAMLASAPFDDWWHNAYGLDVRVLSPPHAVLAAGMAGVVIGATLLAVSVQNGAGATASAPLSLPATLSLPSLPSPPYGALYLYSSGVLLTLASVFVIEYTFPLHQHSGIFYRVTSAAFPFFLVAAARGAGSRTRFPATIAAAVYMTIFASMDWVLPLFPAEPRLAPIYNPITRMVPFCFPLLLVAPALAIDLLLRRFRGRDNLLALLIGVAFPAVLLAVQWPFALFQMTPAARNWFFVGDRYWSYWFHPDAPWRYGFETTARILTAGGFLTAAALAIVSSRLGLVAGNALARVRR